MYVNVMRCNGQPSQPSQPSRPASRASPPFPTHPSSSLKPSDIFWKADFRDSGVQSEASSLLRFDVFPFLKKFRNGTDFQIMCFVCELSSKWLATPN